MEIKTALDQLSALAQENRLAVFHLLVRAGPDGLPAGEIAQALDTPANTLSAQLAQLSNAGLVHGRREGRSIIYTVQYDAMSALIMFLMEDCCAGHASVRQTVLSAATNPPNSPCCPT